MTKAFKKSLLVILLIILFLILFACTSNKTDNIIAQYNHPLEGEIELLKRQNSIAIYKYTNSEVYCYFTAMGGGGGMSCMLK